MNKILIVTLGLILDLAGLRAQSCFTPSWTGNGIDQMNFYITKATINSSDLQIGDEIGVFDGSICVGAGVITKTLSGGTYLSIFTSKDDPDTPSKDGFTAGNTITFKLCINAGAAVITNVSVNYLSGSGIFSASGSAMAELIGTAATVSIPTVTTAIISSATSSSATGGGIISSDGGAAIIESGVCWSLTVNPTIYDAKTSDGTAIGSFTSTISGLINGVTYHIRAFATNYSGTAYGSDIIYFHITTGIEVTDVSEIKIYPNPVSDILNIEYKNDKFKIVNVLNSRGIHLEKVDIIFPRQQLYFSKYESGIYFLEFVRPDGSAKRMKVINQ